MDPHSDSPVSDDTPQTRREFIRSVLVKTVYAAPLISTFSVAEAKTNWFKHKKKSRRMMRRMMSPMMMMMMMMMSGMGSRGRIRYR